MERAPIGSVEVDWCGACEGTFVDPGELSGIQVEGRDDSTDWLLLLLVSLS